MVDKSEADFQSEDMIHRILVIYTGGTIGMVPSLRNELSPIKNRMLGLLRKNPQVHDNEYSKNEENYCILPKMGELRIKYKFIEYEPLLDSSNMSQRDWVKIAISITQSYNEFDGFVVLMGTDTLAYTSSALSFIFENLKKPVVVTGSQIPIFQPRTDGYNNLISALYVAATSPTLHEVVVVFGRHVLRANRAVKVDNERFDAFMSPNMRPLAELEPFFQNKLTGIPLRNIEIEPLKIFKNISDKVTVILIYPSIQADLVKNILSSVKGAVLLTYGNGNIPSNDKNLLHVFAEAVEKEVLIINITQCSRGSVSDDYEAGAVLKQVGVISGKDMTLPAAFAKLTWVINQNKTYKEKIEMLKQNLRGELTE